MGEGHQKFKLGFREGHTIFSKHCCSLKINKQNILFTKQVPCTVSILNFNNDQPEQPNNPTCMSTLAQKRSLTYQTKHFISKRS